MSPRQIESNNESSLSEPLLPSHLPSNREIEDERSTSTPCNQETDNAARTAEETQPQASVSRNVHLTLIYTGFAFAGRSIWNSSVLAAYVFLLKKNDLEAVGYITAVMGMTQFACSVPTGWLVDYHRRDFILKLASVAGFVAIGVTSFALWTLKFSHLVAALAAWGCCWGMANTSLSALFADSIPTGQRSLYFTRRSMILTGGVATGPIVSLIMFALLGDEWNVRDCAVVMLAGQVICFPAMVLLCFFSDDFAVEVEADAPTSTLPLQEEDNSGEGTCRSRTVSIAEDSNEVLVDVRTENEVDESSSNRCCAGSWSCTTLSESRKIAILVASADLMAGLSSGMSIRYFPIFFKENLQLSPVLVQVLYILAPMCQTCTMRVAQWLSTKYGRCHVSAVFKWLGISLMFGMIMSYQAGMPTWFVCGLYVFRTGCANATGPLTRSVLMDNVPKHERGKWASLESLNMFSWSGSAALGGVLVGVIGMLPLFATTAMLQLCATIPLVILFGKDTSEAPGTYSTDSPLDVLDDESNEDDDQE